VFGVERDVRAEVVVMNGFSAHADQSDLVCYAEEARKNGPVKDVVLVHGEGVAMNALKAKLAASNFDSVHMPKRGDRITVR
jgi:metallo-beta-lactamase family protein